MKSCGGRDGATRVSTSSPATARLTHSASPRSAVRLIVKRTGSSATISRAGDLSATAARAHHKSKARARGGLVMKRCRGCIRVAWGAVSPRLRGGSDSAHPRRRSVAQMPRLGSAKPASRAAREGRGLPSAGPRGKSLALRPGQRAPQSNCSRDTCQKFAWRTRADTIKQALKAHCIRNRCLAHTAIVHPDEARQRTCGRYNSPLAFISLVSMHGAFPPHGRGPLPRLKGHVRAGAGASLPSNR
ncbi:hypothetical protein LMG27177_03066 [Paraburkholderia fynbosensis]|uniref:Uncharacterized protein n=1 Tax=Paraburkholderia fynbosensis TaxID=1200993 RepID=A0A6J5G811_9BURK|nr:hypothetical protein LMG27177_03066 [Paraburkholderia fynbosensis]